MLARRLDQAIGDLDVDVVEGMSRLVEVVVRDGIGNKISRGMH